VNEWRDVVGTAKVLGMYRTKSSPSPREADTTGFALFCCFAAVLSCGGGRKYVENDDDNGSRQEGTNSRDPPHCQCLHELPVNDIAVRDPPPFVVFYWDTDHREREVRDSWGYWVLGSPGRLWSWFGSWRGGVEEEPAGKTHLVFVYGTLKKGFHWHQKYLSE